jgi:hypothetical protein
LAARFHFEIVKGKTFIQVFPGVVNQHRANPVVAVVVNGPVVITTSGFRISAVRTFPDNGQR